MNRKEAIDYNEKLKIEIECLSAEYEVDFSLCGFLVDNHIVVFPDNPRKGMLFLGEESVSYKPGNIRIDLKNALESGMELLISLNRPNGIFNYIQLLLATLIFIKKSTKLVIGKVEAFVVYVLHKENAYYSGIDEEDLICKVQKLYREREEIELNSVEISEAINQLYENKVVDFKNGNVKLIEVVWSNKIV